MFGPLGFPELLLILVLIFLLFGPDKLPQFSRLLGRAVRAFKQSMDEAKSTIDRELKVLDPDDELRKIKKDLNDLKKENLKIEAFDDLYRELSEKDEKKPD